MLMGAPAGGKGGWQVVAGGSAKLAASCCALHAAGARRHTSCPLVSPGPCHSQLPGAATEDTIHAPVGRNYRISLGTPSNPSACMPLLAAARAGREAPAPEAPAAEPGWVATLEGVTEFDVVTGGARVLAWADW